MKKISFNHGTLGFERNLAYFELPRSHIYLNSVEEIQRIHDLEQIAFPCTVELKEEQLEMKFVIEKGFIPFLMIKKANMESKLNAAEFLVKLGYFFFNQQEMFTIFDPLNFFVNDEGEIKVLYRGIKGLMPADGYEDEPILDQVKRMLLLLFSGARYDELRIHGLSFAKSKTKAGEKRIVLRILQAENFPSLLGSIQTERKERQKEEKEVKQEQETTSRNTSWLRRFSALDRKKQIVIGLAGWILSVVAAFIWGNQSSIPTAFSSRRHS